MRTAFSRHRHRTSRVASVAAGSAATRATSIALAVASVAALAVAPQAHAQEPVTSGSLDLGPAVIAVTARGEDEIVPDRARLSLGVQTQAPTAAAAARENARAQQAVLDAVRAQGVPGEQITTSGYAVYPTTEYDQPARRTRVTGYTVQNTVTVELRRTDQVGPVLDAVLAKGANVVSSLEFYSSESEASRRRALARAVERARADAEAMAAAAGGRLGSVVELSSSFDGVPRPMMAMARMDRAAPAPPTPISEGTQTTSVSVSARWRFVVGR